MIVTYLTHITYLLLLLLLLLFYPLKEKCRVTSKINFVQLDVDYYLHRRVNHRNCVKDYGV